MIIKNITAKDNLNDTWYDFELGECVVKIEEHRPAGEGDKWFYDVVYKNGDIVRLFEVSAVLFVKEK